jgi:hypothetical protein
MAKSSRIGRTDDGLRLTPSKCLAGCLVVLCTLLAGAISSQVVDNSYLEVARSAKRTFDRRPQAASDLREEQRQMPLAGYCVTLEGKQFQWPWANAPFGVLNCSR